MIKFKDKALIGGTWFDRGMVAEFDAKTEADLIAEGDAVAYVIEVSGTIETANHALTADTATNATNAVNATNAINAQNAITADSATNAGHATTADNATTAQTAVSASSATNATTAGYAATAETAGTAGHATTADTATTAGHATTATSAGTADTATSATTADTATTALTANSAETANSALAAGVIQIHPYYHFHGFAGDQFAGESLFYDKAGINHGKPGANLSSVQMFANAGYISTVDPVSGSTDSVIRIPSINFDYNAGEKLIVWWLGKVTAEASQQHIIGDGYSTTVNGWGITSTSSGKLQVIMSGATQGYSGQSSSTLFDGTLHSFGVVMDGQGRRYSIWSDDSLDANFINGYLSFNSGNDFDVRSTSTVNIGASSPAPGGTAGIAVSTRALVILRLPADYALPGVEAFTDLFRQLRNSPGKLILERAI